MVRVRFNHYADRERADDTKGGELKDHAYGEQYRMLVI